MRPAGYLTIPDAIRAWVEREFTTRVEEIITEMIDVATGNRVGNAFVRSAMVRIEAARQRHNKRLA